MKAAEILPSNKSLASRCDPPKSNEPADIKDWCLARADVWYQQNDLPLARIFLQYALDIDPTDTPVWIALGSLHFTLGNSGAALVAFTKANELHPGDATIHLHLALTHQKHENWSQTEWHFRRALELNPNDTGALKLYSGYLMARGRLSEARLHLEHALSSDLDDVELFLRLGVCCYRAEDLNAAQACFKRALQLDPINEVAKENLHATAVRLDNQPGADC